MAKEKGFNKKSYAIAILRRGSYRLRARSNALKAAKVARNCYRCAICLQIFGRKEIQVDHKSPVTPITGWVSFDDFIDRLYCEEQDLQVLCKPHHKIKSQAENQIRKFHRDAKKKKEKDE